MDYKTNESTGIESQNNIERLISSLHQKINWWKSQKPSQKEIVNPSLRDKFNNPYPFNPLKDKILYAHSLIQEYRRSMSIGPACNKPLDIAIKELDLRRLNAIENLIKFCDNENIKESL